MCLRRLASWLSKELMETSLIKGAGRLSTHGTPTSTPDPAIQKKMQLIYTDPAQFRSGLVYAVKEFGAIGMMGAPEEYQHAFSAEGYWGKITQEKEAILTEALGPDFITHPMLAKFEMVVLFQLGQLEMVRNRERFNKIVAGQAE